MLKITTITHVFSTMSPMFPVPHTQHLMDTREYGHISIREALDVQDPFALAAAQVPLSAIQSQIRTEVARK